MNNIRPEEAHKTSEYKRVADLYDITERNLPKNCFTDMGWSRYQASLGVFMILLNGMSSSERSREVLNLVQSIGDLDLVRKAEEFKDRNQQELVRYMSVDRVKEKIEVRERLMAQFLSA